MKCMENVWIAFFHHTSFKVVQYFSNMVTVERFAYHLRVANVSWCVCMLNSASTMWMHCFQFLHGCMRFAQSGFFSHRENILWNIWSKKNQMNEKQPHLCAHTHICIYFFPQLIKTYEHWTRLVCQYEIELN